MLKTGSVALAVGVLFGVGLGLSGMTQPSKVVGFLDIFGAWDPSLAFVMVGAIAVHSLAYRGICKMHSPFLADTFQLPTQQTFDRKLIGGAALFGAGWGLAGYCPGPALTSLVSLQAVVVLFVAAMVAGMWVQNWMAKK